MVKRKSSLWLLGAMIVGMSSGVSAVHMPSKEDVNKGLRSDTAKLAYSAMLWSAIKNGGKAVVDKEERGNVFSVNGLPVGVVSRNMAEMHDGKKDQENSHLYGVRIGDFELAFKCKRGSGWLETVKSLRPHVDGNLQDVAGTAAVYAAGKFSKKF